jgi:hypothetical protein
MSTRDIDEQIAELRERLSIAEDDIQKGELVRAEYIGTDGSGVIGRLLSDVQETKDLLRAIDARLTILELWRATTTAKKAMILGAGSALLSILTTIGYELLHGR